jgi:hypothetical protein
METQNRFDLNQELARWRMELAQHGVRAAEANELESHLHDSMKELQNRGLSEQEAHWISRFRLGSAPELAEQFAKADPVRLWRDRVFWAAALMLGWLLWMQIWGLGINGVNILFDGVGLHGTWNYLARQIVTFLPLPIIVILIARGSLLKICAVLTRPFRTQRHLAKVSVVLVACMLCVHSLILYQVRPFLPEGFLGSLLAYAVWPVTLVLIMLGMAPREHQPAA